MSIGGVIGVFAQPRRQLLYASGIHAQPQFGAPPKNVFRRPGPFMIDQIAHLSLSKAAAKGRAKIA